MIKIEVVFAATPESGEQFSSQQQLIECEFPQGISVREAIEQSGILKLFPAIDLDQNRVGIFSEQVSLDHLLSEGDRVEIYRPLKQDPKEARRIRAKRA